MHYATYPLTHHPFLDFGSNLINTQLCRTAMIYKIAYNSLEMTNFVNSVPKLWRTLIHILQTWRNVPKDDICAFRILQEQLEAGSTSPQLLHAKLCQSEDMVNMSFEPVLSLQNLWKWKVISFPVWFTIYRTTFAFHINQNLRTSARRPHWMCLSPVSNWAS